MKMSSSKMSSTPSSSPSSSSSSPLTPPPKRRKKKADDDTKNGRSGISETAIARRLGRRLRSMTQLLREDTPQASAILTTGLSTTAGTSSSTSRERHKDHNDQHTTNIGDIIKSAGFTTVEEEGETGGGGGEGHPDDMLLLPCIDNSNTVVRCNHGPQSADHGGGGTLLPQLKFDESGNIVLAADDVSGGRGDDGHGRDNGHCNDTIGDTLRLMETRDESGQNNYRHAYKKSIGGKWSKEDTNLFYKGIEMYGPDLMLISTVFGSTKTPAQLRQKLKVEGKRNPNRLNKALESGKAISLQEFEKAHGPIPEDGGNNDGVVEGSTAATTGSAAAGLTGFDYQADLARILDGLDS
ncbi:hypothetical protein FOZ61_007138 [Perkinsus olseni]|uniref:SANT domain-containing protein n=1 Tax=Perkinsus olseni TaxID=32597 RepID=A0A7J6LAH2_PEROL|nr:hypothetical protein FOZ61_007138 [Perkinsus olseni]KAF4665786.1 hypothetical protein FOL46_003469 [Perkinsus olseni]